MQEADPKNSINFMEVICQWLCCLADADIALCMETHSATAFCFVYSQTIA
jgi:hypothetical protein